MICGKKPTKRSLTSFGGFALATTVMIAMSFALSAEAFDWGDPLHLQAAHALSTGTGISVAVLSTGTNYKLPWMTPAILPDPNQAGAWGWNTFDDTPDVLESAFNDGGTYASALIAHPTFGVAPDAKLILVKVISGDGSTSQTAVEAGIEYAAQRGARIIYLGFTDSRFDHQKRTCAAIQNVADRGILVVQPAGNQTSNLDEDSGCAPCAAPNRLMVTALQPGGNLAAFSNYGEQTVQVAAPGVSIPGFGHLGQPLARSGTAVSAALATGVAALVAAAHPDYTPAQIRDTLVTTAVKSEELEHKLESGGSLDAATALGDRGGGHDRD